MERIFAYIREKEKENEINLFSYINAKNKIDMLLDKQIHISAAARYGIRIFTNSKIKGGKTKNFTDKVESLEIIEKEIKKTSFDLVENYKRVMNIIKNNNLSGKEETILIMHYINGYNFNKIAEKLELSNHHCRRLHKAAKEKILDNALLNDKDYNKIFLNLIKQ